MHVFELHGECFLLIVVAGYVVGKYRQRRAGALHAQIGVEMLVGIVPGDVVVGVYRPLLVGDGGVDGVEVHRGGGVGEGAAQPHQVSLLARYVVLGHFHAEAVGADITVEPHVGPLVKCAGTVVDGGLDEHLGADLRQVGGDGVEPGGA